MLKLSKFENIFIRMTQNYVKVYSQYAFELIFDDLKYPVIGKSNIIIKIKFNNSRHVFERIFREGSIGLGESYCEGLIEVEDKYYKYFLCILVKTIYEKKLQSKLPLLDKFELLKAKAISPFFTNKSQKKDINSHYSLDEWFDSDADSNQFYLYWLDSHYVQYTCAKWDPNTKNLEDAQINKFEFYAKRLGIDRSSRGKFLMDLGCGWGGFMFYLAEKYGLVCVGLTLSTAQARYISDEAKKRKLEDRVTVKNINVHSMSGKYDFIISVGLLEHIDDYNDLYEKTSRCLKPNGHALFHAMFHEDRRDDPDPFLSKYIFPGGCVTNIDKNIRIMKKYFKHVKRNDLPDMSYPKTLDIWYERFCANEPKIRSLLKNKSKCKDIDFAIRMFKHYLMLSWNGLAVNGHVCNVLVYN